MPEALTSRGAGSRRRSTALRVPLIAALLLALGACSTGFLYNQLDWFITWRLNSYFSLDEEQEDRLREMVSRNLEWIRVTQMPRLAGWLRAVDRDVADGEVSAAMLDLHYRQLVGLWDDVLRHVVPDAATFLADLRPAQVEVLIDNLQEENEEFREKYSGDDAAERRKRREKAIVKNTRRFTGRLSDGQRALVRYHVSLLHDNSEEWLRGRRAWQLAFRDLLLESPPPELMAERLLAMSLDPNSLDEADYRRRVEENRWILLELFASLLSSLDEDQAARFSRRLNRFADDFEALAADSR